MSVVEQTPVGWTNRIRRRRSQKTLSDITNQPGKGKPVLTLSPLAQLTVGFGLGALSALFPTLLRLLVTLGLILVCADGLLLYQAGGASALHASLLWLAHFVRNVALLLASLRIGNWSTARILGQP